MTCQQEDLDRYILYTLLIIIFYSAINVIYYHNKCNILKDEINKLKADINEMVKESKRILDYNSIFF